jgi:hypothetical protein
MACSVPNGNVAGMNSLTDQALGKGDLTTDVWGVQKVSLPYSLFHGMWTFDIPETMWFMYENGTQVYSSTRIASTGGVAKVSADATVTTARLESRECPRYQPNRGHLFSTAGWFPNKTADGVRDFGLFTNENGVFFRLKADGKLYAVRRSGGVEVYEEEINTSVLTGFNVEKSNIYDIQFQWRSAGNYNFYIGDPAAGVSKLVHQIALLGTLTAASVENPALPVAYKATRTTQDVSMYIGCADVTSENGRDNVLQYASAYSENVAINGSNVPAIAIKSPLLINSKTNTRQIMLARISFTCSKKAVFKVWTTRDPTALTGATFQNINNGSFTETDSPDTATGAVRATASDPTKMRFVIAVPVEAAVTRLVDNPNPDKIAFNVVRGDYIVVTCTASTALADVVVEWGEYI